MRRTATAIAGVAALLVLAVSGASAASLQLVHQFSGPDGGGPVGQLIERSDGYLYGVASYGGIVDPATNPDGHGTIYRVNGAGAFQTLHTFDRLNGQRPNGLVLGPDGFFYGTTSHGGDLDPTSYTGGQGTLFRADAAGDVTVLHRFMPVEGSWPSAAPTFGQDGALYGTSQYDSTYPHYGTVWRWSATRGLEVLHQFDGFSGKVPLGPLTLASDGNLYGTANGGGTSGCGVVFRIEPPGTYRVVHSLAFGDGCQPKAGVIQARDGNFYGTTETGSGWGTVFRLTPLGTVTRIHAFDAYASTGMKPTSRLFEASDGFLWGTAQIGGQPLSGPNNRGVVFRTSPAGDLSVVHTFSTADGSTPTSGVMQASDGAIYGVTPVGGAFNRGVVYRLGAYEAPMLPTLASLLLSQTVVKAGWSFPGTVRLSSGAPAGGAEIALTSSNARVATVPASVKVAQGKTTATFTVWTKKTRTGTVTISATYRGVTRTAQLVVAR
jgi:uncharacterized repeat protein (TIGR03803 family)